LPDFNHDCFLLDYNLNITDSNIFILGIKRNRRDFTGNFEGVPRDLPLLTPRQPPGNPQVTPRQPYMKSEWMMDEVVFYDDTGTNNENKVKIRLCCNSNRFLAHKTYKCVFGVIT